jgi:hypothetical protein
MTFDEIEAEILRLTAAAAGRSKARKAGQRRRPHGEERVRRNVDTTGSGGPRNGLGVLARVVGARGRYPGSDPQRIERTYGTGAGWRPRPNRGRTTEKPANGGPGNRHLTGRGSCPEGRTPN